CKTLEDCREDCFRAALPRRIEDDRVPRFAVDPGQPVFNAGAYEPDTAIWNSIQTDVHFGILDGLPVFLDPYNSRARRRERKRKQAAAAVQVENTFCAGDALHRATLQHGRGADVRLEKRIR